MNTTLLDIFGPEWSYVRRIILNGKELHMAHDICKLLGLSNTTTAIRGVKKGCNVDRENRTMEHIECWNKLRTIHLLTIEGVLQLILNNKSTGCKKIKDSMIKSMKPLTAHKFNSQQPNQDTAIDQGGGE